MGYGGRDVLGGIRAQGVSALSPVYFFYGGEEFLKDRAVALIKKKLVEPSTAEFNFNSYHVPETDMATIIYAANSLPFLAEKRLVIVKNLGKLPAAQDELLDKYLENPSPASCLVLVGGDKNPKRKIFEKIEGSFPTVNFYNLFERDIISYINEFAAEGKKKIGREAAGLIYELTGKNMLEIKNEVEKLVLYCAGRNEITPADVEKCSGGLRESTGYDLIPPISEGNPKKALKLLLKMLNDGEDGIKILSAITDKFKQYHRFFALTGAGEDERTALAKAGVRFYREDFLRAARGFSGGQIKTGLRLILDSELKMKSGANPGLELEKLLLNLCQTGHKARHFS